MKHKMEHKQIKLSMAQTTIKGQEEELSEMQRAKVNLMICLEESKVSRVSPATRVLEMKYTETDEQMELPYYG